MNFGSGHLRARTPRPLDPAGGLARAQGPIHIDCVKGKVQLVLCERALWNLQACQFDRLCRSSASVFSVSICGDLGLEPPHGGAVEAIVVLFQTVVVLLLPRVQSDEDISEKLPAFYGRSENRARLRVLMVYFMAPGRDRRLPEPT